MKTFKASRNLALALFVAVLAASLPSFCAPPAGAQVLGGEKDKVAADVKQKVAKGERVNAIVQSAGAWTSSLTSAVTGNGGSVTLSFTNLKNMRVVSLPAAAVGALARRSDVDYISLDREVKKLGHVSLTSGADAARIMANYSPTYDGTGIGIAVFDSGLDPSHVAFTVESGSTTRIKKSVDFTGEGRTDDPYGHGTHVTAIAAGNGQVSNGAYRGIAPNANLVNLRVLNQHGTGRISWLLSAIDWVRSNRSTYNIRVVNMSLGASAVDSYTLDPLCRAVRGLVDLGIVVVAAAGNEGRDGQGNKVYGQIHAPGNDPSVITVGASNSYGTDARNDDTVATYSSRGPTRSYWTDALGIKHYDNLIKPDLVAPGNRVVNAQSAGNLLVGQNPVLDANVSGSSSRDQMFLSGTSMATPAVSGAAALLLQANPTLTPNLVKTLLMYTAQQLAGFNTFEQGAGQLNVEGAMRLARLVRSDLSSLTLVGSPLLTAAAPSPQTTIAGHTFTWSQGAVMDHTFATGLSLVTKYQKFYGLGTLIADGTIEAGGVMMADLTVMSSGVVLADHILTSNGVIMSDGTIFLSCGVLISDGVLLNDGTLLSDGVLISDGSLLADGALLGDVAARAHSTLIFGDNTASMRVVVETTASTSTSTKKR
ncbi:MAG TPA: S8 family serine peptidase [Pyrinomonadaceae bacterium]|nr:S8 family serine peptidase [Pyrinomonadaceae bacterium]